MWSPRRATAISRPSRTTWRSCTASAASTWPPARALKTELKLTDVAGQAIAEAAASRPDMIGISAAMVSTAGLMQMAQRFPDRVYDTAIAEQHSVTLAAGMAMAGKRPVVAVYSAFLQRAFDQIVADVALHDLPVVFLVDRAGITGPDGPSHHGVFDLSYLRMIPNMVVGAPGRCHRVVRHDRDRGGPRRADRDPLPEERRGVGPGDPGRCRSRSGRPNC